MCAAEARSKHLLLGILIWSIQELKAYVVCKFLVLLDNQKLSVYLCYTKTPLIATNSTNCWKYNALRGNQTCNSRALCAEIKEH